MREQLARISKPYRQGASRQAWGSLRALVDDVVLVRDDGLALRVLVPREVRVRVVEQLELAVAEHCGAEGRPPRLLQGWGEAVWEVGAPQGLPAPRLTGEIHLV